MHISVSFAFINNLGFQGDGVEETPSGGGAIFEYSQFPENQPLPSSELFEFHNSKCKLKTLLVLRSDVMLRERGNF